MLTGCSGSVQTATALSSHGEPPPASCVPGERWVPLPASPFERRYMAQLAWNGSKLFVWGGLGVVAPNSVFDSGGLYDDWSNSWSSLPEEGAPPPAVFLSLLDPAATVAAGRFFTWGETAAGSAGGTFDPTIGAWAAVTANEAPSPRQFAVVVSTGNQIIVWGGAKNPAEGLDLDTGAVYDPVQDRWTPMTTVGAPAARNDAGGVWMGSKMMVWGGINQYVSGYGFASGGVYDPVADRWASVSTVNAPGGSLQPAMVWTGSRVIVWGPSGLPGMSDGGSYDPETDTWELLPAEAALVSAGSGPPAVWTGSRMILFARTETGTLGAAYDPADDTWSPVSTDVLPADFLPEFAAWDGCRVILWGEDASGSQGWTYQPE
jgi:hypothetical protein